MEHYATLPIITKFAIMPRITEIRKNHPFVAMPKVQKEYATAKFAYIDRKGQEWDFSRYEKANILSNGDTNTKTAKNTRKTKILYLVPATKSGVNYCEKASKGCIASCLFSAGRGAFVNVINARKNRSYLYNQFEDFFLQKITKELAKEAIKLGKQGKVLAVRLNGTSDLPFVEMLYMKGLLSELPKNIVFYDYTKHKEKAGERKIGGFRYVVTFSRSEDNGKEALQVLDQGGIVAVVFRGQTLPKYWFGYKVVDGDERDDLMLDLNPRKGNGIVIGLRAKGQAKGEVRGFVIDCDSLNDCRVL